WTCFSNAKTNDPLYAAGPCCLCILRERLTGLEADSVVVYAKIRGMRVRYVDSNERYPGTMYLVSDHRRHVLVDLKFDHQIYTLPHELVSILQCSRSIVAVVQYEKIHSCRCCRGFEALGHIDGKWHLR